MGESEKYVCTHIHDWKRARVIDVKRQSMISVYEHLCVSVCAYARMPLILLLHSLAFARLLSLCLLAGIPVSVCMSIQVHVCVCLSLCVCVCVSMHIRKWPENRVISLALEAKSGGKTVYICEKRLGVFLFL